MRASVYEEYHSNQIFYFILLSKSPENDISTRLSKIYLLLFYLPLQIYFCEPSQKLSAEIGDHKGFGKKTPQKTRAQQAGRSEINIGPIGERRNRHEQIDLGQKKGPGEC